MGCLVASAGCNGRGQIELTSLAYHAIDPPAARFARIGLDRCYWYTDEEGQVCVAMESERSSLFGRLARFSFQLSLVLERPPAGRARNYSVAKRELRAAARLGPAESRFVSVSGIVALYREEGARLRGNFRLQALRQVNRMLGGWGQPSRYLILGRFEAVHDEERGRRIAAATEARGWERQSPPTARPSSQPATRAAGR
ncbi:MAG: hypothetical protein KKB50_07685 [Planctomycetes bacterium]|nr:hypothetical protein [Planctomycetota bacterium]